MTYIYQAPRFALKDKDYAQIKRAKNYNSQKIENTQKKLAAVLLQLHYKKCNDF